MNLILRVALNQNNPQRAKEAQQLLRTQSAISLSLLHRIAFSNGDKARARGARKLLRNQVKYRHCLTDGCEMGEAQISSVDLSGLDKTNFWRK